MLDLKQFSRVVVYDYSPHNTKTNRLVIFRGLPGSGKSTLAKNLTSAAYSADDFMVDDDGNYKYNQSRLVFCHNRCQESVADAMASRKKVIAVHNTCCQAWEMMPYIELAEKHGYSIEVIDVYDRGLSDFELSKENQHGVDTKTIGEMRRRYEHEWRTADRRPPWARK